MRMTSVESRSNTTSRNDLNSQLAHLLHKPLWILTRNANMMKPSITSLNNQRIRLNLFQLSLQLQFPSLCICLPIYICWQDSPYFIIPPSETECFGSCYGFDVSCMKGA